jgi:hypothetical protein
VAAEKWLKMMQKDEKVQNFLAVTEIHWQFNLSRAPWWGGQFERLIGQVKRARCTKQLAEMSKVE